MPWSRSSSAPRQPCSLSPHPRRADWLALQLRHPLGDDASGTPASGRDQACGFVRTAASNVIPNVM
jgi:hypothetical protein